MTDSPDTGTASSDAVAGVTTPSRAVLRVPQLVVALTALTVGLLGDRSRPLVATLLVMLALIALHEAGHLIAAKRAGVGATEFSVGFGPLIGSTRPWGGTVFSWRAVPFGGYVTITGMSTGVMDDASAASGGGRSFEEASWWRKMSIVVAGPAANVAVTCVCLLVLFGTLGVPKATMIVDVQPGSPAARAGLLDGDELLALDGVPLEDFAAFARTAHDGPFELTVRRDDQLRVVTVTPTVQAPRVGVVARVVSDPLQPMLAVRHAVTTTGQFAWVTVGSLGALAESVVDVPAQVLGGPDGTDAESRPLSPVGAARLAEESADADGPAGPVLLIAAVSMFLAVFNMLPIPPLDGGHAAVLLFEKGASQLARRPVRVDRSRLAPVAALVVAVVLVVGMSALLLDVIRPVTSP